jgi:nitrate reductase gamma subunit
MLTALLYAAAAVFIAGNVFRILRIATMPVHVRWELYPVPHETRARALYGGSYLEEPDWWQRPPEAPRRLAELRAMAAEVFLMKGVWEHQRAIWAWSWMFHFGLYFLVASWALAGVEALGGPSGLAPLLAWPAFVLGAAGTAGMLWLRAVSSRLRPMTSFGTVFNLLLLFAIFASGLASAGKLHWGLIAFFLAYFPFTHMTHMYLKFFAYHSVRWDDRPAAQIPGIGKKVGKYLKYPVGWSATHVGKGSWAEILKDRK